MTSMTVTASSVPMTVPLPGSTVPFAFRPEGIFSATTPTVSGGTPPKQRPIGVWNPGNLFQAATAIAASQSSDRNAVGRFDKRGTQVAQASSEKRPKMAAAKPKTNVDSGEEAEE